MLHECEIFRMTNDRASSEGACDRSGLTLDG
jgi:hypothetical protein